MKIHKSVHLNNLYRMKQDSDEAIRALVARVTGTADMCGMTRKCTKEGCDTDVSYKDDVKQRVLSRSGNGELETLDKLVQYISAEEAAMSETVSLSTSSSSLSNIKQSSYMSAKSRNSPPAACKFCGETRHTPANT